MEKRSTIDTHYDRPSGTRYRTDRVWFILIKKIANNTKNNRAMISLLIISLLFLLTDSPQKLKLEKIMVLIILFYISLSSHQLQRVFFLRESRRRKQQERKTCSQKSNVPHTNSCLHFFGNSIFPSWCLIQLR